jgi:hypothetical protein
VILHHGIEALLESIPEEFSAEDTGHHTLTVSEWHKLRNTPPPRRKPSCDLKRKPRPGAGPK